MTLNKNFILPCAVICIASAICGHFLFSVDKNVEVWTQEEQSDWLRRCSQMGRERELCECMVGELQILYPKKNNMNQDMKENPGKFSQAMIETKESCE